MLQSTNELKRNLSVLVSVKVGCLFSVLDEVQAASAKRKINANATSPLTPLRRRGEVLRIEFWSFILCEVFSRYKT